MAITYAPSVNFGAKDSLPSNDPSKVIKGSEFSVEFTAIQTAFNLAAPNASPTFTGTVTIPTADINGGNIDGTVIGGASAAAGTFTNLTASGTVSFSGATVSNGGTVTTVDINGGNIDGTVIGAATPAAGSFTTGQFSTSLNVDGTVTADGLTVDGSGSVLAKIESTGANFSELNIKNTSANYVLGVRPDVSHSLVIRDAGNVANRLAVATNGDISFYEDTGTTPKFFWDASAESLSIGSTRGLVHIGTGDIEDNGTTIDFNALRPLSFSVNNTERMRLDASGNLLVGTTTATHSSIASKCILKSTNNVLGVVTDSGSTQAVRFTNGTTAVGSINLTTSTTSYATSSDARLKENIADAEDAGAKVDAIQVRQFDWKADGSHQDYGMIAQELLTVAPEAVSGDSESDDMMGVDYSKLVPMMLKEIQSLRARVAQLEGA